MSENINWFRTAIPYIKVHKNNTFVILLSSLQQKNAKIVLSDIAYLHSLNIKIVLVCGIRDTINRCLKNKKIVSEFVNNLRITDEKILSCVKEANALVKLEIETILSSHLDTRVISGNFITAQPFGVIDGVDFKHTGKIRNIDIDAINNQLDNIVLLSPLGFSSTGEIFNLSAEEVASITCVKLSANKLVILHSDEVLCDNNNQPIQECTTEQIKQLSLNPTWQRYADSAIYACDNKIDRVHILNTKIDGVLLQELFSANGGGTMITTEPYETIRQATSSDSAKITQLIQPLIKKGMLIDRSKNDIENDIENYYLLERDAVIIGVTALIPYGSAGEIACVAIDKSYQNNGRGTMLLTYIENLAKQLGMSELFVLSTQTSHWFLEHGFLGDILKNLPVDKNYDCERNAKFYRKQL